MKSQRRMKKRERGRPPLPHLHQQHVEALQYVLGLVKDGEFKTKTQAIAWASTRVGLSYGSLKRYAAKPAYCRMAEYLLAEDAIEPPDWATLPIPPKEDFA